MDKNKIRTVLGGFFLLVAVMGALGMVTEMLNWELFRDAGRQFNTYNASGKTGHISTSLAPVYYTACLVVGSWLLFGRRES